VRDQPVERGVIEPNGPGLVLARRVPGQLLERGPADRDVQPEHARAVQVRGGVPAVVVLGDDGGERHPAAGGVVIRVVEEERVAQAASGAPFASLAVTVATPGRLLTNAMISSAVIPSSFSLTCRLVASASK
jgi:hypothetical protein